MILINGLKQEWGDAPQSVSTPNSSCSRISLRCGMRVGNEGASATVAVGQAVSVPRAHSMEDSRYPAQSLFDGRNVIQDIDRMHPMHVDDVQELLI